MPERDDVGMTKFDVIANHYAIGVALELLMPFLSSSNLKNIIRNPKVGGLGCYDIVVYSHLIIEECFADTPLICVLSLKCIHEIGIVDEYFLNFAQFS